MDYEVLLNGERIDAEIKAIEITDRYGSQADDIRLSILNNPSVSIDEYSTLACSFGGFKSGKMYIDQLSINPRTTLIGAISAPTTAKEAHTRNWLKVRLFDMVNDVAVNYGLSVYYEGITNHFYENVTQYNETDFAFINRLCIRESYSLKIDDNRLIIYKNSVIEGKPSVLEVKPSDVLRDKIVFAENPNKISSVTVKYFADRLITHTATKTNNGGSRVVKEYLANNAEAERYSYGYLSALAQNNNTVDALLFLNDKVAAGSCVVFNGFEQNNGKYFINECCYDPVNDQMRIIGRKVE